MDASAWLTSKQREDVVFYQSQTYPQHLLSQFSTFKEQEQFCDFTVICGGHEFRLHRIVLASCSDYFKVMLTGDYKESHALVTTLTDVDPSAFEEIIKFAYTGEIIITSANIEALIIAASIIQVQEIEDRCTIRFMAQLTHENCLSVVQFADKNGLRGLYGEAMAFCLRRFKYIAPCDEFLRVDSKLLKSILLDKALRCSEEQIFQRLLHWIDNDPLERDNRLEAVPELMECVRFSQMTPRYLCETVSTNKIVQECPQTRRLVERAKDYQLHWKSVTITDLEHPFYMQEDKLEARNYKKIGHKIYAIGGWNQGAPIATFEEYDPKLDEWKKLEPMQFARCGLGAAIMDGKIYSFGGHDGTSYLDRISCYDLTTRKWDDQIFVMEHARTSIAVGIVDDCFYIIGGQEGKKTLDQVHRFNPFTMSWSDCSPMISRRLGAGVAVIGKRIYVVGGGTPPTPTYTRSPMMPGGSLVEYEASFNSVEYYDILTDKWTKVTSTKTARKHAGCVVNDNLIYAVGGRDSGGHLNTAEVYDPQRDEWTDFPPMQYKRSGLGLICLDNVLYAIGGFDGNHTYHRSVEAYDLRAGKDGKWETRANMSDGRLGGGFVAFTGIE